MWAEEELLQTLGVIAEEAAKLALCPKQAIQRLSELDSPSEKLVFLFLSLSQPQTFTGIRRALKIGKSTLSRTLKKLWEKQLILIGEDFMYWVDLK